MKKRLILKRITTFVLLFALVAGMATAYTKRAEAAGGWKVTITYYNGESNKTYNNCPTNSTVKLPTPTKTISGATFIGWKLKGTSTLYNAGQIITIKSNMDFLGVWRFNVSFYVDSKLVATIQQKTGYNYGLPSTPSKTGYVFDGWVDKKSGSKISSSTTVTMPNNREVKASFRKCTPSEACTRIDKVLSGIYDPKGYYGKTYSHDGLSGKNWGYAVQCNNDRPTACGMCPICAIGNLLNRGSVLYYGECRFNFERDVITKLYYPNLSKDAAYDIVQSVRRFDGIYRYDLPHGNYENQNNIFSGKNSTQISVKTKYYSAGSFSAATLNSLLNSHPEGVAIYADYGNNTFHACVITKYVNGNFYAIDTGDGACDYKSDRLFSQSWFCNGYCITGVNNVLRNCAIRVWYIDR